MKRGVWLAILAACAIAGVYVIFLRRTDEDRIRGQLRALSAAVRLDEGDNQLLRAARVQKAYERIFKDQVELHIPELREGPTNRGELSTLTIAAGKPARAIDLKWESVRVEVDRPMNRGLVTATATLTGSMRSGQWRSEARDVVLQFEKPEGEWRIAAISLSGAPK